MDDIFIDATKHGDEGYLAHLKDLNNFREVADVFSRNIHGALGITRLPVYFVALAPMGPFGAHDAPKKTIPEEACWTSSLPPP